MSGSTEVAPMYAKAMKSNAKAWIPTFSNDGGCDLVLGLQVLLHPDNAAMLPGRHKVVTVQKTHDLLLLVLERAW